jgi:hypothetical protein
MALLDRALTETVIKAARLRPRNKHCFSNAFNALTSLYFSEPLPLYVEGWAHGEFGPIWHGWLETLDGRVIDTTPTWRRTVGVRYQAVGKYTIAQLSEHSSRRGSQLPIQTTPCALPSSGNSE